MAPSQDARERLQGAIQPGLDVHVALVGNLAHDSMADLRSVDFLDMGRDVPIAHSKALGAMTFCGGLVLQNGLGPVNVIWAIAASQGLFPILANTI